MSLGTCTESIGIWPCRPGLDLRKCMNCKEYRSRLEQEVRLQKKAADFRAQSDILREEILQKIEKERVSQAPTNLKVVVGGHTYLAESEEAAKALRNLFVDM